MKFVKIASGVSASVALLGTSGAASMPQVQVQAAVKYQIRVSKKAYVYTSKGKKTKKSYKKNAKVTAYGTKWIKGKKYYSLGKGRYIRTSNAKKVVPRYRYSTQTKKITRTIKMYQPKGVKKVIQNAYIKRTVKTDNKTKKKTYGVWSTSSWKKYKVAKVSGYTASRSSVGAAKVTYKRKNQTIKITYKVIKKTNKKKKTSKKTDTKHATKPSTTPSKPVNSGYLSESGGGSSTKDGGLAEHYNASGKSIDVTVGSSLSEKEILNLTVASTGEYGFQDSDVIKSLTANTAKLPFKASVVFKYGGYRLNTDIVNSAGSYKLPITIAYVDGTVDKTEVTINVKGINHWDENTKASARAKILDVINDFRSKVGENPVALDTTLEYQTFMDQRAAEKAKIFADTGQHDHSGDTLAVKYGVYSGEYVGTTTLNAGDSLNDQTSQATASVRSGVQAEKDDYEAIYIRHERTNITNGAGTVGHYENFINQNFTRVVIGTGTYVKDGVAYTAIVMAEIMNEK